MSLGVSAPSRLGRYELLAPIGTGGMATVYWGRTRVLEGVYRDVAIKLMHPHLGEEGNDGVAMLLQEAEIAARIRHPNVVPVEEAAVDPAGVYLAMPYVEGDSLAGLIRAEAAQGRTLPTRIVGRILLDALAGLHAAHELRDEHGNVREIVHRDFTPSNILVGVDGIARLTDFGVARLTNRAVRTTTGHLKGKIGYMSPEQVRVRAVDRRTDVWAAGVVAWECLAGRRLFEGDELGVLLRIAEDPPPRLRTAQPGLPHALEAAVASALERQIESRCQTAEELRVRLARAFESGDGIAEADEVATFVQRVAGRALAERRERAARATSSVAAPPAAAGPTVVMPAPAPVTAASPVDGTRSPLVTPASNDTSSDFARPMLPGRRSRRPIVLGVALAVFGFVGVAGWLGTQRSLVTSPPPSGSSTDGTAPDRDPSSSAPPLSAGSTSVAAAKAVLRVRADLPMTSLSIGGMTRLLASPSREVDVEIDALPTEEIAVEAVAASGERGQVVLAPGASSAEIRFAATPRDASSKRPPAAVRLQAPSTGSGGSTKGPKLGDYPGKR
jgi:serine/threonine-protein kinase